MSDNNIMKVIKSLGNGETLDEAIKEASDKLTEEEVTTEEEVKEAEATTEEEVVEEDIDTSEVDYDKLAEIVLAKKAAQDNSTGSEKVDNLVAKLNEGAEKQASSQEKIVTALFNEHCMEDGEEAASEDIAKLAADEDSQVPHLVDCIYKFAAHADSILAEEYGEDDDAYNEDDVIKMASVLINSTENPFEVEETNKEAEEEVSDNGDGELDKQARAILDKLANEDNAETIESIVLDKIKDTIRETSKS